MKSNQGHKRGTDTVIQKRTRVQQEGDSGNLEEVPLMTHSNDLIIFFEGLVCISNGARTWKKKHKYTQDKSLP